VQKLEEEKKKFENLLNEKLELDEKLGTSKDNLEKTKERLVQ
jgi:hypothetical protein